jgi:hypothetical protein
MTFHIEYEAMCGCCRTKSHKTLSFSSYEEMNEERMYLLQVLEEAEDLYFSTLQVFQNNKILSCYYVCGNRVMLIDNSGEVLCEKRKEVA